MKQRNLFVESGMLGWETVGDGVQRQILGHDPQLMMVCVKFNKGTVVASGVTITVSTGATWVIV